MTPEVSVVIVSYRSREPLVDCLESLRACGERIRLQVIVVDNASDDGTVEWVSHAHPEVELVANPDNRGFTRGVNQGLERSRGAALFVLNPDCIVTPEALERLLASLAENPGLAAVAPMLLHGDGHPARSCGRFPDLWTLFCDHLGLASLFPDGALFGGYKYGGRSIDSLRLVDWASGAALLIPRAAYLEVGGLDQNIFMYMEEVDWCRRAALLGRLVRYVPQARIVHHGQLSSRKVPGQTYLHNLRSRVYYFRKHHGRFGAFLAKVILVASLAVKWCIAFLPRSGRSGARVYADGVEAVWAA